MSATATATSPHHETTDQQDCAERRLHAVQSSPRCGAASDAGPSRRAAPRSRRAVVAIVVTVLCIAGGIASR